MDVRTALVTGANRGIGLAVVAQLVERGYRTVLGSRDLAAGERAARGLRAGDRVLVRRLDVTDPTGLATLATALRRDLGHLDVLVKNAGIDYDTGNDPLTADLAAVTATLDVNALGAWRTIQHLHPLMRDRGRRRRIVNVSSESGSLAAMGAGTPAYAVSKAALNAVTRVFAARLRGDGILVNSVCPGWVATDMGGPGGRPVADGAASVLWAVDLPDDGPTGGFFRDGAPLRW
jgi:NAD(P)-dependent dehydrogenase (short-subunit alcohol dehydrogenase family)